jgi:hypothetical protein
MCKARMIAVSMVVLVVVCVLCAQSSNPALPAGPVQAKVTTVCAECHEARIILQQRLSKAAWTKEVDKMIKWGALVAPEDHDAFVDYLSSNFGADKPAYVADRLQNSASKVSKK